jgi:hypothetical protein
VRKENENTGYNCYICGLMEIFEHAISFCGLMVLVGA